MFPDSVVVQTCLNVKQRSWYSYFWLAVELIRSAGDEDGQYDKLLESKTNKEDLVAIFDSLNLLGGCAWRTNKRILDIAVHMFNNGGYEDLAIPGPVVQPEVDSISLKWASVLNLKDQSFLLTCSYNMYFMLLLMRIWWLPWDIISCLELFLGRLRLCLAVLSLAKMLACVL